MSLVSLRFLWFWLGRPRRRGLAEPVGAERRAEDGGPREQALGFRACQPRAPACLDLALEGRDDVAAGALVHGGEAPRRLDGGRDRRHDIDGCDGEHAVSFRWRRDRRWPRSELVSAEESGERAT